MKVRFSNVGSLALALVLAGCSGDSAATVEVEPDSPAFRASREGISLSAESPAGLPIALQRVDP